MSLDIVLAKESTAGDEVESTENLAGSTNHQHRLDIMRDKSGHVRKSIDQSSKPGSDKMIFKSTDRTWEPFDNLEHQIKCLESQSENLELLLEKMRSGTSELANILLNKLRSGATVIEILQGLSAEKTVSTTEATSS